MLNDIQAVGRWKTHLCLIINCGNLQGLMSITLLHAIAWALWQTGRPQLDADEKPSICTLTIVELKWQFSHCKGRAVCVCACTCIRGYFSSCTGFSNLQSTWKLRERLASISDVIAVIFWTSALFVVVWNLSHDTLLFKYPPFVWNKRRFEFHFCFTSASLRC